VRAGEVARRAGVNAATLRYYERRGLLPAPSRTPSGHRHYDEDAVRFLRAVKEAQAIGFTLAEIEEYLRVARSGPADAALRTRAAAKIDEIDARIARLRRMRDELARIVGCACESLDHCTCGAAYLARRGREAPARPSPLHVTNGDSAPDDGLSGTERRALRAIANGAGTPAAAFLAAQDLEAAPFLGDAWFFRALTGLGTGPARLVETQAGEPIPPPPPLSDPRSFARLPLRLTGPGQRVMDGRDDRVALLGLDRWLGGTHLTPAAAWRWDPDARLLVRPGQPR
jgi:DNA-binding transcriptional MerR regulator